MTTIDTVNVSGIRAVARVEGRLYFDKLHKTAAGKYRGSLSVNGGILAKLAYLRYACTISGGTVTIPEIAVEPTDNALIGNDVRATFALFDADTGKLLAVIAEGIRIPATPSATSWAALKGGTIPAAPNAPAAPVATAIASNNVAVVITSVPGAATYKLQRKVGAGSYLDLASGLSAGTYHDTTTLPFTGYTYKVSAHGLGGDSPYSAASNTVTTPAEAISPIDPSTLSGYVMDWDPDAAVGSDGALITTLPDAANGGDPFTSAIGGALRLAVSGINGHKAIEMASTGSDHYKTGADRTLKTFFIVVKSGETPFADFRGLTGADDGGADANKQLLGGNSGTTQVLRAAGSLTSISRNGAVIAGAGSPVHYDVGPIDVWFLITGVYSPGQTAHVTVGRQYTLTGRGWNGLMGREVGLNRLLTAGETRGVELFLINQYGLTNNQKKARIIYDGDSFFDGGGGSPGLDEQIETSLGARFPSIVVALSGHGVTDTMLPNIATNIYPNVDADVPTFIVCTGFTNGLAGGESPATLLSDFLSYVSLATSHGIARVLAYTVVNRKAGFTGGMNSASFAAAAASFNASLLAHNGAEFDVLDVTGEASLNDADSASFNGDQTHPSVAGYAIMAGYAVTKISSLI